MVIGNPRAGRGTVSRCWENLLDRLERSGRQVTGELTERRGHATELARRARADGCELVVAVGGDGTVHEIVNGLLAEGTGADAPMLGLVPAGSGCDYARTFGVPADVEAAVAGIVSEAPPRLVDVGQVAYQEGGEQRACLFVNVAQAGIGAEVARRAGRVPRALGAGRYAVSFVLTLPGDHARTATVELPGGRYEGPLTNLVVAVGQYFGGGMHIAPTAEPGDGLFDVQIQFGSKLDYTLALPKVFRGTHLPHPRVREERAARVEVSCEPAAPVEADGEILGITPARFEVLPGALWLRGGRVGPGPST